MIKLTPSIHWSREIEFIELCALKKKKKIDQETCNFGILKPDDGIMAVVEGELYDFLLYWVTSTSCLLLRLLV